MGGGQAKDRRPTDVLPGEVNVADLDSNGPTARIAGVGGGVCQVSTTVFRAPYFGGFPIVLRYSHAYRVGYYERGDTWKGPGLDATVYAPLVDFQFKNDTPSWLLMEVHVDRSLAVCPAAPRNEPFAMVAAAGYITMCTLDAVVLETSIRRWMTVPGAR